MKTSNTVIKILVCCLLVIGKSQLVFAFIDPVTKIWEYDTQNPNPDDFFIGNNVIIEDNKRSTISNYQQLSCKSLVKIGINLNHLALPTASFTFEAELNITPYPSDPLLPALPVITRWFRVTYDPNGNVYFDEQSYLYINDGYKLEIEVNDLKFNGTVVNQAPPFVYLQSDIIIERFASFTQSTANAQPQSVTFQPTQNEILVQWDNLAAAEGYELEWVFVDGYQSYNPVTYFPASSIIYNFTEGSTRIFLMGSNATSYAINAAFPAGFLLFRVRPLGKHISDPKQWQYGRWSTEPTGQLSTSYWVPGKNYIAIGGASNPLQPFEEPINWQYQAAYSDNGLRKDVVSFFDATLRERQTVTQLNSDETAIVKEMVYDYLGRPTIDILPSPIPLGATSYAKSLEFYPNFNRGATGTKAYSWTDFDVSGNCASGLSTGGINLNSGAGLYYSISNPDQSGHQAYTPDAAGFPFTRVRYTPDQTGRVAAQGGLGTAHQLGSGHETKFLYGVAYQESLNALFGTEVGWAEHYRKQVTIDPNGQSSITYTDLSGRTIATALAGEPTSSMDILNTFKSADTTVNLSVFNKVDGQSLTSQVSHIAPVNGTYNFSFSMAKPSWIPCDVPNGIDFAYDVTFSVLNSCGQQMLTGGIPAGTPLKYTVGGPTYDFIAGNQPASTSQNITFSVFLPAGEYQIVKQVTFKPEAINYYLENFLTSPNPCLDPMPTVPANVCDGCQALIFDNTGFPEPVSEQYFVGQSYCEAMYDVIVNDLTPGGQYMTYNLDPNGNDVLNDPLSFLSNSPTIGPNWKTKVYKSGSPTGPNFYPGAGTPPAGYTLAQFLNDWQPHWFLNFQHPEQCYYNFDCGPLTASFDAMTTGHYSSGFDAYLFSVNSFVEAETQGLIDLWGNLQIINDKNPFSTVNDPFFSYNTSYPNSPLSYPNQNRYNSTCNPQITVSGQPYNGSFPTMESYVYNSYPFNGGSGENLYQLAIVAASNNTCNSSNAYCNLIKIATPTDDFGPQTGDRILNLLNLQDDCLKDKYWITLRSLYVAAKMKLYESARSCLTCASSISFVSPTTSLTINDTYPYTNGAPAGGKHKRFVTTADLTAASGLNLVNPTVGGLQSWISNSSNTGLNPSLSPPPSQLDECGCDKILQARYEMQQGSLNLTSLDEAIFTLYGINTMGASEFECVCNDAFRMGGSNWSPGAIWPSAGIDQLQSLAIPVGPGLACEVCFPCTTVANAFNSAFNTFYLGSNPSTAFTQIENSLNTQFGFNLTYWDYETFVQGCGSNPSQTLCANTYPPETYDPAACCSTLVAAAQAQINIAYQHYLNEELAKFRTNLLTQSMAGISETFNMTFRNSEYHFTLYYYDQAGNLVKTVPPLGVKKFSAAQAAGINTARTNGTLLSAPHVMASIYTFNSLNLPVKVVTPDNPEQQFFYDALKRMAASQNEEQKINGAYFSYLTYDAFSRVKEQGEKQMSPAFSAASLATGMLTSAEVTNLYGSLATSKREITTTYYDVSVAVSVAPPFPNGQNNLRNRVAAISYDDKTDGTYKFTTYYSYDIRGNVQTLIHDYPELAHFGTDIRFKIISYDFDQISGKVNQLTYQPGKRDTWIHKFTYDADQRLLRAMTSENGLFYDVDASYSYYKHGPLSRTVLGQWAVQGLDYTYTIHGWMKGLNSNTLVTSRDPGRDGNQLPNGGQFQVAPDVAGFTLGYFNGDYNPIKAFLVPTDNFEATNVYSSSHINPLYNGNINHMVTAVRSTPTAYFNTPQLTDYRYDQLNRIKAMDVFTDLNVGSNSWPALVTANKYNTQYTYDANGNLLNLNRKGDLTTPAGYNMDQLAYTYYANNNRLRRVTDAVASGAYPNDIDNQTNTSNYTYDRKGRLKTDVAGGITNIVWNQADKVRKVSFSNNKEIEFRYDAMGQRYAKIVKANRLQQNTWTYTYYVRDAQGNVLATYDRKFGESDPTGGAWAGFPPTNGPVVEWVQESEYHIYGSSRVGVRNAARVLRGGYFTHPGYELNGTFKPYTFNANTYSLPAAAPATVYAFTRGRVRYEITNHLGNVLATISDRKRAFDDNTNGLIDRYAADVWSYSDYYPFGSLMPGRHATLGGDGYRYGFQNQETDDEIYGEGNAVSFEYRVHDPRIGRFFSVDPLSAKYPWNSPYAFSENRVIDAVELEGLEKEIIITSPWLRNHIKGLIVQKNFLQVYAVAQKAISTNWPGDKEANWAKGQFDQGQAAGKPVAYTQKDNEIEMGLLVYSFNDQNEKVLLAEFKPETISIPSQSWFDQLMSLFDYSEPRPFGFSIVARGFPGFDNQNQGNPDAYIKETLDISALLGIVSKYGGAEKITTFGNLMDNVAEAFDQGYEAVKTTANPTAQQSDTLAFTCTFEGCKGKVYIYRNKTDLKNHTGKIHVIKTDE